MHHSKPLRNVPLALLLLACAPSALLGQSLLGPQQLKGSGVLQTCDTSMHVDFSTALLDGYTCQFTPVIEPGAVQVNSTAWHFYNGFQWAEAYGSPTIPYFGPEPYPMCLSVDAFDPLAAMPCSTTVCKLITPVAYAVCADLQPAFSIGAVQGSTITFVDQTVFEGGQVEGAYWSFGDGSAIASSPSPTHEFSGAGPFRICLTVVGAPPTNCTATLCQWLYMGPGNLPCEQLVRHGFATLQYNEIVGAIDTSLTSGMNARIDWDFGDGARGSGAVVAHAYQPFQTYALCGTLKAWGPLLSDTCTSTICRDVYPMAAVSVAERDGAGALLAWPSPFDDELRIRPLPDGGEAQLLDGLGRRVLGLRLGGSPAPQPLPTGALPPGCYTLLLNERGTVKAQRVVKQP